jgi:hypothetical protein
MFGQELKVRLLKKQSVEEIGVWSHSIYLKYIEDIKDDGLDDILLILNTMELGSEFAFSYVMLNKLADDLILDKEIDTTLNDYRQTDV